MNDVTIVCMAVPQTMQMLHLTSKHVMWTQGHTEAWFHLGVMHLNGWGTVRNLQQAQYFFSMAAKVGHTLGTYNLAMLQLSRDAASCPHALELLKKVAGAEIFLGPGQAGAYSCFLVTGSFCKL